MDMNRREIVESEAMDNGFVVDYTELTTTRALMLVDGDLKVIQVSPSASEAEKCCLLAEELGHYHTSAGNTVLSSKRCPLAYCIICRSEEKAMRWAIDRLITMRQLADALSKAPGSLWELADLLEVSEPFLERAIELFKLRHGLLYEGDDFVIMFEPLAVYLCDENRMIEVSTDLAEDQSLLEGLV